ncbi:MAG: hypothetical protein DRH15_08350 [Deltaproteobacteria bacterium]|nr:MAG: hypothetical protein DRH15_08350 [Deltaproteobacteria bacterium]
MDLKAPKTVDDPLTYSRKQGIMRLCLIASLTFHVIVLVVVNRAFPIKWAMKPLRIYHVELIRPPVKDMDLDKDVQGLARLKDTNSKPVIHGEDTISLDTTDKRYVSYAKVIKEALLAQWKYPQEAKENLVEGQTFLVFTLSRDGTLLDLRLLGSSGYKILDEEAMRAVRAAAPFPAFPGSVTVARLHIKANFDYRLAGGGNSSQ